MNIVYTCITYIYNNNNIRLICQLAIAWMKENAWLV